MDKNLIDRRRDEVIQEINLIQKRHAELEKELVELDTAERVIARLTGAIGGAPSQADEPEQAKASSGKPGDIPTMPEMIAGALSSYPLNRGAKPKDVRDWIARKYWPDVKVDSVASIMWRMWKRDELEKRDSLYVMPEKKETDDANPGEESSSASLFQPDAQGREAGPGGGT